MSNVIFANAYKLKEGSSVQEFLLTVERLYNYNLTKHKGFISLTIYNDGDAWGDAGVFETQDDLDAFLEIASTNTNEFSEAFYSFLDFNNDFHIPDEDIFKMPIIREWYK